MLPNIGQPSKDKAISLKKKQTIAQQPQSNNLKNRPSTVSIDSKDVRPVYDENGNQVETRGWFNSTTSKDGSVRNDVELEEEQSLGENGCNDDSLVEYFADDYNYDYELSGKGPPKEKDYSKLFNYTGQMNTKANFSVVKKPKDISGPQKLVKPLDKVIKEPVMKDQSEDSQFIQTKPLVPILKDPKAPDSSRKVKLHPLEVTFDFSNMGELEGKKPVKTSSTVSRQPAAEYDIRRPYSREMSSLDSPKMIDGQIHFPQNTDTIQVAEREDENDTDGGEYIYYRDPTASELASRNQTSNTNPAKEKGAHSEAQREETFFQEVEDESSFEEVEDESNYRFEENTIENTVTVEHTGNGKSSTDSHVVSSPQFLQPKPEQRKGQQEKSPGDNPKTVIKIPVRKANNGLIRNVFEDKYWKQRVPESTVKQRSDHKVSVTTELKAGHQAKKKKKGETKLQIDTDMLNLQPLNTIDDVNFFKYQVDPIPESKNPVIIMNFTAVPPGQDRETVALTRQVQVTNPNGTTPRSTAMSVATSADTERLARERRRIDETEDYFDKLEKDGLKVPLKFMDPEMAAFMNRVMVSRALHRDKRHLASSLGQEALRNKLRDQALGSVLESYEKIQNQKNKRNSNEIPLQETTRQRVRKQLKAYKPGEEVPPELLKQLEDEILAFQRDRKNQHNFPLPLPDNEDELNLDENEKNYLDKSVLMGLQSEKNKKLIDVNPNSREPRELADKTTMDILHYYEKINKERRLENDTIHSEILDLGEGGHYKQGWDKFELEELNNDSTVSNPHHKTLRSSGSRSPEKLYLSVREAANSRDLGHVMFINKDPEEEKPLLALSELHRSKADDSLLPAVRRNVHARRRDSTASDYSADYDEDGVRLDPKLKAKRAKYGNVFDEPKPINKDNMTAQELLKRKKEQEAFFHRIYNTKPEDDVAKYQRNINGKRSEYEVLVNKGILIDRSQLVKDGRGRKGVFDKIQTPKVSYGNEGLQKKKSKVTFADDTKMPEAIKKQPRLLT